MGQFSQSVWHHAKHPIFLLVCLLLFCLHLRGMLYASDPLVSVIEKALGLSLRNSAFYAVLPLFCLGIAAPFSTKLSRYYAASHILSISFWLIWQDLFIHSYGGVWGLYAGIIILGSGGNFTVGSLLTVLCARNEIQASELSGFAPPKTNTFWRIIPMKGKTLT